MSRAQRTPMAGGCGPDLRPGEKMLPAAQADARHTRDASGDRDSSHGRLTGIGLFWEGEHRVY